MPFKESRRYYYMIGVCSVIKTDPAGCPLLVICKVIEREQGGCYMIVYCSVIERDQFCMIKVFVVYLKESTMRQVAL